jgi:hypothetical protein
MHRSPESEWRDGVTFGADAIEIVGYSGGHPGEDVNLLIQTQLLVREVEVGRARGWRGGRSRPAGDARLGR